MKLEAAYGTEYDCPQCGRHGYYKPPYNTLNECMSCRWQREHPKQEHQAQSAAEPPTE
jgi:ribosomal protein L37AE/L43A